MLPIWEWQKLNKLLKLSQIILLPNSLKIKTSFYVTTQASATFLLILSFPLKVHLSSFYVILITQCKNVFTQDIFSPNFKSLILKLDPISSAIYSLLLDFKVTLSSLYTNGLTYFHSWEQPCTLDIRF